MYKIQRYFGLILTFVTDADPRNVNFRLYPDLNRSQIYQRTRRPGNVRETLEVYFATCGLHRLRFSCVADSEKRASDSEGSTHSRKGAIEQGHLEMTWAPMSLIAKESCQHGVHVWPMKQDSARDQQF